MVGKYKHKLMKKLSKAFKGGMSGFTLIEMLIVIAIIAILAGIVLTGVRGFQSTARDTKRIGDTRNMQNLLELFFTRNGAYPPTGSWVADLDALGNVPTAPAGDVPYAYTTGTDDLSYCLIAELENQNSGAINDASGGDCPAACNDGAAGDVFCATSG